MLRKKLKLKRGQVEISHLEGLNKKSIISIIVLPVLVLFLGFTGYQENSPQMHRFFLIFMIFLCLARLYNAFQFYKLQKVEKIKQWWTRYKLGAISNAIAWGVYSFYVCKTTGNSHISYYLIMINLGISAGATSTMYMDLKLVNIYIALLCAPLTIASYFWIDEIVSMGLLIHLLHTISHTRYQYNIFWQGQDSKLLMETVIDAIPGPLSYVNRKLEYIGINKYLADFLQVNSDDITGKPIGYIEKKGDFRLFIQEFFDSDKKQMSREIDVQVGNRRIPMLMMASKFNNSKSAVIIGVDISERVEVKNQLEIQRALNIEASKLASLGEMAGGIAHEVNNPLAIISGKANQIINMIDRSTEQSKLLTNVRKQAKGVEDTAFRIAKIIKGMRQMARSTEVDQFIKASVSDFIEDALSISREKITNNGVKLELENVSKLIQIECMPTQISQVILNLVNNAYYENKNRDSPWIHLSFVELSDKIQIRVKDSGNGIPPEQQEKLFQPFFTTKAIGHGMGLGLSISKTIVEKHYGRLFIDNTETNTCFVLELPKVQPKINTSQQAA